MPNEKVKTDNDNSASEVVREELRLLRQQDELKKIRLDTLRKDIQKGIDSLDRGKGQRLDIEAIKKEGRKRLDDRRRK